MKMKPVDPAAVIRDPHTKRPLAVDGCEVPESNFWTRRWLAGEVWRLDSNAWVRRAPNGELVREPVVEPSVREETPSLAESITPPRPRS